MVVYPALIKPTQFAPTATAHALVVRATDSATTSSSDTPFFPDPSTLVPPPSEIFQDDKANLTKSLLEYVLLGFALLLVAILILRRFRQLRHSSQPISTFFHPQATVSTPPPHRFVRSGPPSIPDDGYPRVSHSIPMDCRYPSYPAALAPLAAIYAPGRRIHAADTDFGGRRQNHTSYHDHDGMLGDKDFLPAYESVGGPPKYVAHDPPNAHEPPPHSELHTTTPTDGLPVQTNEEGGGGRGEAAAQIPQIQSHSSQQRASESVHNGSF